MRTVLVACGALAREVLALRDQHGWEADVQALPALLHNTPHRITSAVVSKIKSLQSNYDQVIVIYGDCGTSGELDKALDELGVERIAGPHCYEMYADQHFDKLMDDVPGTYFLTDYLVQSFDHLVIEGLGLDRFPELRDDYFGNYERMIYLQQRTDPTLVQKAHEAATLLQLPLEIRHTGYGALETRLLKLLGKAS